MVKKVLLFLTLFSLSILGASAQGLVIKGVVIDGSTGESIPFANLSVLGTKAGVAADMDGVFELTVPQQYAEKAIRVSVVGFLPYEIKASEAAQKANFEIVLKTAQYSLGEVSVDGVSMVYKKMIQRAVNNISVNYINVPYNYEGYYQNSITTSGALRKTEAVVSIYDKTGYIRSSVYDVFKNVNYTFKEMKKSSKTIASNFLNFDDILTADIVRNSRNVMDIDNIRDFTLSNKGKYLYEGDTIQVIGYVVKNPNITLTGVSGVSQYSGEIYINQKNYVVLKNVMNIVATDFSGLGRNISSASKKKIDKKVNITITTNYRKQQEVYYLNGININYNYVEGASKVIGQMQYMTTSVNTKNPMALEGRIYYDDSVEDPKFWDGFTVNFQN